MNNNTILRIKVPANLYESVKKQLTLNEAKKAGHNYGAGMEVVKEKKMKAPKDGMQKVEEEKVEGMKDDKKKVHSLEELMKAKKHLEKKINEMETSKEDVKEYVGMSPDQMELVNTIGQLIAGGAASASVVAAYKTLRDWIKSGKKPMDDKEVGGMEEAKEKELNEASLELDWASGIASLKKKCEKHGLTFKVAQEKGPAGGNPLVKINGPKDKIILFLKDGYADADQLEDYTADIKGN
jgi:TolA-binding protein